MPMLDLILLVLVGATIATMASDTLSYAIKLIAGPAQRRATRRRTLPPVDWAGQADVPVQLRGLGSQMSKPDKGFGDLASLRQRIDGGA
jgi:hypothetical protein